jgi:hypothetical protein
MMDESTEVPFGGLSPQATDEVLAIVARIVHQKGGASDWTLQKTYFLACVESIEDRLTMLQAPRFFSWTYGPWSKQLRDIMDLAESVGEVNIELVQSKYQPLTKVYEWPKKNELPPMKNPEDATFVESFVSRVKKLPGEQLTMLAKQTTPFVRTPAGQPIDLGAYLIERTEAIENLSNDQTLAHLLAARTR